jgi:hypothetical protein
MLLIQCAQETPKIIAQTNPTPPKTFSPDHKLRMHTPSLSTPSIVCTNQHQQHYIQLDLSPSTQFDENDYSNAAAGTLIRPLSHSTHLMVSLSINFANNLIEKSQTSATRQLLMQQ